MSTDIFNRGDVILTRSWRGDKVMYQLSVGAGYIEKSLEEMEILLIDLLTEITNEK